MAERSLYQTGHALFTLIKYSRNNLYNIVENVPLLLHAIKCNYKGTTKLSLWVHDYYLTLKQLWLTLFVLTACKMDYVMQTESKVAIASSSKW